MMRARPRPGRAIRIVRTIGSEPYLIVGTVLLFGVGLAAIGADVLAPYPIDAQNVRAQLQGPSRAHLLGTDQNGRDVLSLLLHGARVAIMVGVGTVSISMTIGTVVGAISGYIGGRIDNLMMRVTDVVMAFPGILLAILIMFLTRRPGLVAVIFALSVTGWAGYARLVRGQVLVERELSYVEAARALGLRAPRILFVHVLPNTMAPLLVQATFGLAGAILAEAALSFLGLGPQGAPSWGALLDQGAMYFLLTPHLAIFPGIAIMITVLGVNFLGDGLRDALDPRTQRRIS